MTGNSKSVIVVNMTKKTVFRSKSSFRGQREVEIEVDSREEESIDRVEVEIIDFEQRNAIS